MLFLQPKRIQEIRYIIDAITPNLPILHCINFVGCCIFSGNVVEKKLCNTSLWYTMEFICIAYICSVVKILCVNIS